jgi:very-short-patch-repair endonuclease
MTDAERKLWGLLRCNHLGVKFRRQVPFDNYVVDFYCAKAKLIVELDGDQHYTRKAIINDVERDKHLQRIGCKVVRYSNNEIFNNEDGVMQDIYENLKTRINKFVDPL